jgi:hypothetical protein
MPKGGTHLLTTLLDRLPQMRFSGATATLSSYRTSPAREAGFVAADIDWSALRRVLDRVPDGQYLMTHFPYCEGLADLLTEVGFRQVLIVRDPRDIVVSDAYYMRTYPRHRHHKRFRALTLSEAIDLVITGFRNKDGTLGLESIGERARNYAAWRSTASMHVCTFESLIGRRGGGDDAVQVANVAAIAAHVGRPLTNDDAKALARSLWSERSHTFRSGKSGGWRDVFSDEQVELFKAIAGGDLIALGYERSVGW